MRKLTLLLLYIFHLSLLFTATYSQVWWDIAAKPIILSGTPETFPWIISPCLALTLPSNLDKSDTHVRIISTLPEYLAWFRRRKDQDWIIYQSNDDDLVDLETFCDPEHWRIHPRLNNIVAMAKDPTESVQTKSIRTGFSLELYGAQLTEPMVLEIDVIFNHLDQENKWPLLLGNPFGDEIKSYTCPKNYYLMYMDSRAILACKSKEGKFAFLDNFDETAIFDPANCLPEYPIRGFQMIVSSGDNNFRPKSLALLCSKESITANSSNFIAMCPGEQVATGFHSIRNGKKIQSEGISIICGNSKNIIKFAERDATTESQGLGNANIIL